VKWALPCLIVVATFAAFHPVLQAGFVNYDDGVNFTGNPQYRGLGARNLGWMFTTRQGGHWQPLSWMTLGLDYTLWGMDAPGYHFTNLLLHAGGAVALYFLILALLGREDGPACASAAAGALLFSIHPLRVESVAWITERRDVLSGLLYVLAVLFHVRWARTSRAGWYWGALACAVASSMSKAWAMTLPLVLLAVDVFPLRRLSWKVVQEKAPFAAVALGTALMAVVAQRSTGAMPGLAEHSIGGRLVQSCYGLCFYLWKTLWPTDLVPLYYKGDGITVLQAACVGIVAAIAAVLVSRRRKWPAVAAAFAAYAVIVSPVLGIAQTGLQMVADRYSYLATIPFAMLVAAGLAAMPRHRAAALAACGGVLAVLGVLTWRQSRVWHDSLTLWDHAIRVNPRDCHAYTSRGLAKHDLGRYADAVADFDEAIRINARWPWAWSGRGLARYAQDDLKGALSDYDQCLRLMPHHREALANRGLARARAGDFDGAIADCDAAIAVDRRGAEPWNNRGLARLAKGDVEGAIADFTEALARVGGRSAPYLTNRGIARERRRDFRGAMADFGEAMAVDPRFAEAYRQRGALRLAGGDARGALVDLTRLIEAEGSAQAWAQRALLRVQVGDLKGAIADFDQALKLNPRDSVVLVNRGSAKQAGGDLRGAQADYVRALDSAPADWAMRAEVEGALEELRRRMKNP